MVFIVIACPTQLLAMVLKLYGWFASGPALVAALILHEKNIPFEWVDVDIIAGESKSEDYLAKFPFGLVPAIDDNGLVLYESRAIARYLEEKYPNQGTQLLPKDLQKRALVDQAIWAEAYHYSRFAGTLVFEILNKRLLGAQSNTDEIEKAKKTLFATLDIYEKILSKQKYIAGDELTLADLVSVPVSGRLIEELNLPLTEGRPNVERWLNELLSRDSWQKVKEIFKHRV